MPSDGLRVRWLDYKMIPIVDTRRLFRPLCRDLAALLRALPDEDWDRPTLAGAWRVRDVVAHLLDTALRRLSFDRDRRVPPPAARPIENDRDLVAFINELNAIWIRASQRLSARALTDLYAIASEQLSDFVENVNLDRPARFPVSWAGPAGSRAGLDIGREFTEVWHHGAQIRDAVGAGALCRNALAAGRALHRDACDSPCLPRRARGRLVNRSRSRFSAERADRGR